MSRKVKPLKQQSRKKKISERIAFSSLLLCTCLMPASTVTENATRPRIYADPQGRFSFQLSGDWIKLRSDANEGVAGSFLLTKLVDSDRKVVAELLISSAELQSPLSLEEYVKTEDRLVMNTPGFKRIAEQQALTLGGLPALKNRYSFLRPPDVEKTRQKLVDQYYALKEKTVWGLTFSAMQDDEVALTEAERTVVPNFQFSVPEGVPEVPLAVFKKVTVGGALGGFSLRIPETWEIAQSEGQGASIRGPDAVIYAFSLPLEEAASSPQILASLFLKERENLKKLRVLSQKEKSVAGLKGYEVEYSGTGEGRQWHVRLTTVVRGQKAFFLHCVAPEERWEANKETFSHVEQSFSVATPAGEAENPN